MSAECFLDSNIFIYLFDDTDAHKRGIAENLLHRHLEMDSACISYQVVQETLNVLVTKLGASREQATTMLERVLSPFWRIHPSQTLYLNALDLRSRYRYSFYDSLIIAAALEGGCRVLYSEDLQHGQRIQNLRIENPFIHAQPN